MKEVIYLAIPYSWNPEKSFEIANKISAKLMQEGYVVFSPISHSHPIATHLPIKLRINQDFWMNQDLPILELCSKLLLVNIGIKGIHLIQQSKGCQSEIEKAQEIKIPIELYHHDE